MDYFPIAMLNYPRRIYLHVHNWRLFLPRKTEAWKTFSAAESIINTNANFERNYTVESSDDMEIYWNCGKLMNCISFHLRVRMTSQQSSFFEVSNSSSDFPFGVEIC